MSEVSRLTKLLVASLEGDAPGWTFDAYRARHVSGLSVWIANGLFALEVEGAGRFGGMNPLTIFFGWLIPWRVRLLGAIRRASMRRLTAKFHA